jgi:hypothetical protein
VGGLLDRAVYSCCCLSSMDCWCSNTADTLPSFLCQLHACCSLSLLRPCRLPSASLSHLMLPKEHRCPSQPATSATTSCECRHRNVCLVCLVDAADVSGGGWGGQRGGGGGGGCTKGQTHKREPMEDALTSQAGITQTVSKNSFKNSIQAVHWAPCFALFIPHLALGEMFRCVQAPGRENGLPVR